MAQVLRNKANALREFHHAELKRHGSDLRKELIRSAKKSTGGDRKLSGLGNKPTIGVTLRTVASARATTVTLKPSPKAARGPWRWIEEGTAPGRRAVRRDRRRVRGELPESRRVASGRASTSYFHPGTQSSQGREAWSKPVKTEMPKIRKELQRSFSAAMR